MEVPSLFKHMKHAAQPRKRSRFNIADWISLYRIAALPVLLVVLLLHLKITFAVLLAVSLFSDIVDGYVARKLKITSVRGARLDSVGDALTFAMAIAGVIVLEWDFILEYAFVILVAVVPYLLQILTAVLMYGRPTSYHTMLAKTAALFQGCFILILLMWEPLPWLLYTTVAITLLEITEEFILLFLIGGKATNVKGLYWILRRKQGD